VKDADPTATAAKLLAANLKYDLKVCHPSPQFCRKNTAGTPPTGQETKNLIRGAQRHRAHRKYAGNKVLQIRLKRNIYFISEGQWVQRAAWHHGVLEEATIYVDVSSGRGESRFLAALCSGDGRGDDEREETMTDTVIDALIVDLLKWLASGERTYEEVMEAWRTSCPRLTVWEDANDRGLIASERLNGCSVVRPSSAGLELLQKHARQRKI
jgi:hypothetical protein